MTYSLGMKSKARLAGVHPDLVRVIGRAITLSAQDFSILEGVRSKERQAELVAKGASQTLNSRHLKGPDGYGHASDLGAWLGGMVRWEWALYEPIAEAMRQAARETGITIRWGGGWIVLNEHATWQSLNRARAAYVRDRMAQGRKAFLDGPHFELPTSAGYP